MAAEGFRVACLSSPSHCVDKLQGHGQSVAQARRFRAAVAPVKAAVFPLVQKPAMDARARTISAALTRAGLANSIDTTGARMLCAPSSAHHVPLRRCLSHVGAPMLHAAVTCIAWCTRGCDCAGQAVCALMLAFHQRVCW